MNQQFLDSLDEALNLDAPPSKERVMDLTDQMLNFFKNMQQRLISKDPEEQQAALKESMELQKLLESKLRTVGEKTGLSLDQLLALAQNPAQLPEEQREIAEEIQGRFQNLQQGSIQAKKPQNLKTLIYR